MRGLQRASIGSFWCVNASLAIVAGCGGNTDKPAVSNAVGGAIGTGGATADGATGGAALGGDSSNGGTTTCVNADCVAAHSGSYTCIDGQCRPLLTNDCPVLLPDDSAGQYSARELLKKPAPIIIGGFASMSNAADPYDSQSIVNWNLAFTEFNSITSGGLQSYDGSGIRRPLIGLVCRGSNATPATVDTSMAYLAESIRVPAVLSTLSAPNLLEAYTFTTSSSYAAQPVFFMSTGSATMQLASLDDHGLVWHMLGDPRPIAATMAALVKRIEPVVRATRQSNFEQTKVDDPSVDGSLNVTIIYSDNANMVDVHDLLLGDSSHPAPLTFNGAPATDASNRAHFQQVQVVSGSMTDTSAVTSVQTYPPHIIIALGSSEFAASILPQIEDAWATTAPGRMRPFYVTSQQLYNSLDLIDALDTQNYGVENRLVGVNYAAITDDRTDGLYAQYYARLMASYSGSALTNILAGTENMYDAAYYLLYSIAAAEVNRKPSEPITGTEIATALVGRVIKSGAPYQDTGAANLSSVLSQLQAGDSQFSMALWGLDGPPNFDMTAGTRNLPTSAWCVYYDTTQNPPTTVYAADGLIFDPITQTFTAPPDGVPTCLQKY